MKKRVRSRNPASTKPSHPKKQAAPSAPISNDHEAYTRGYAEGYNYGYRDALINNSCRT